MEYKPGKIVIEDGVVKCRPQQLLDHVAVISWSTEPIDSRERLAFMAFASETTKEGGPPAKVMDGVYLWIALTAMLLDYKLPADLEKILSTALNSIFEIVEVARIKKT